MKTLNLLASAGVTGIVLASLIASPAFAWHPKGHITKYVQNVTANGQMADANDVASAVSAKPGDTLKYTIVVENQGAADKSGNNDMYYTKLSDALPAGVELVSSPSTRTITADLGILKPGEKATKEYLLKVTSTTDAAIIKNEACFTGDSKVKDNKQDGCDLAIVKISIPTPPVTPQPPVVPPASPQILSTSTSLPNVGPGNIVAPAAFAGTLGYAVNLFRLKRRANR